MKLHLLLGALAAVSLSLGVMRTVVAQEPDQASERRGFAGVVSSYDGSVLALDTQGGPVNIEVTADASVTAAPHAAVSGVAPAIEQGADVVALAEMVGDGWEAIHVVIKPDEISVPPVTGVVASFENGLLTIQLPGGETKTFEVPESFEVPPAGETVTVVGRLRAGASMDAPPVLTGLRTAAQIRARLESFLETSEAEGVSDPMLHQRLRERIAQLLEKQVTVHVQILERLRDDEQIPDSLRDHMIDALVDAEQTRDQVLDRVSGILGTVDGSEDAEVGEGTAGQEDGQGNENATDDGSTEGQELYTGIVSSIMESELVLEDGTAFVLDDSTEMAEGIDVGADVSVEAAISNGALTALSVEANEADDTGDTGAVEDAVTIEGVVLAITDTRLVLTDLTGIAIDLDTQVEGGISIGTLVEVQAVMTDGRLVATAVTIDDGSGNDSSENSDS